MSSWLDSSIRSSGSEAEGSCKKEIVEFSGIVPYNDKEVKTSTTNIKRAPMRTPPEVQ